MNKNALALLFCLAPHFTFASDIITKPFGYETIYQEGSPLSQFDGKMLTSVFPKDRLALTLVA